MKANDPFFSGGFKIFSINGSYGSGRIIRPKNKILKEESEKEKKTKRRSAKNSP